MGNSSQLAFAAAISFSLLATACWMDGPARRRADPRVLAQVRVSKLEPGPWCRPLGALEGKGADSCGDGASYEAAVEELRNEAAVRTGNYVVIDAIQGPHMITAQFYANSYVISGRLFACPTGSAGFTPESPAPVLPSQD